MNKISYSDGVPPKYVLHGYSYAKFLWNARSLEENGEHASVPLLSS